LLDQLEGGEHALRDTIDEAGGLAEDHPRRPVVDVDRVGQVEVLLRPRHRDVEEPALLLELLAVVEVVVRGEAAVDQPDHEHRLPPDPLREWIVESVRSPSSTSAASTSPTLSVGGSSAMSARRVPRLRYRDAMVTKCSRSFSRFGKSSGWRWRSMG